MIEAGQQFILRAPYLIVEPGIALFSVVLAFSILGDALRDVLDPRSVPR